MGVDVKHINAVTFGIGAFMAGAAGALLSIIFPISPLNSPLFLGKAFVVCVLGGLGSVPGAMVGGLVLGVIESFGSFWFGPEHAVTLSFGAAADPPVRAPQRPPRAARATNEELARPASRSRCCSRCSRWRQQLPAAPGDHRMHVRGAGAVLELHRRACGLSVLRDRGVLRLRRLYVGASCRTTARRWSSPGAVPASPRLRSPRFSAARSCICAATISPSRA